MMLALGSGCKYRLSLAERFDRDHNKPVACRLISEPYQWQVTIKLRLTDWTGHKQHTSGVTVCHRPQMGPSSCRKTSSGLPLILHYGVLYNYLIIYYNVIIIIEIKQTINVTCSNHPWGDWGKNCLPRNRSLVPKRLRTAEIQHNYLCFREL